MKQKGFTLVETMITITLLAVAVVLGNRLFFSVLKGTNKSDQLTLVKQNGDYALSVMSRMIRNARLIENCTSDTIEIENPDEAANPANTWTKFIFDSSNKYIASESSSLLGANARITDTGVELTAGSFTCTLGSNDEPSQVTINFTLEAPGLRPEEKASANFQTTVEMRNIN